MLHETHARISWPALLVVVAHNVLIVGVWVLCQVPLDEVLRLLSSEPEHDVHLHTSYYNLHHTAGQRLLCTISKTSKC